MPRWPLAFTYSVSGSLGTLSRIVLRFMLFFLLALKEWAELLAIDATTTALPLDRTDAEGYPPPHNSRKEPKMYCIHCGESLPEEAKFCRACGRPATATQRPVDGVEPPAPKQQQATEPKLLRAGVAAAQHAPPSSATPAPRQPAQSATLPYNWGKFVGWANVIVGPILVLVGLGLFGSTSRSDRETAAYLVLAGFIGIVMGAGVVNKKQYGLLLVYVLLGFAALDFLVTGLQRPASHQVGLVRKWGEEISRSAAQLLVWGLSTYYFYTRRHEFR